MDYGDTKGVVTALMLPQIQPDREYLCVFVHYTTTFNQQLTAVAKSH